MTDLLDDPTLERRLRAACSSTIPQLLERSATSDTIHSYGDVDGEESASLLDTWEPDEWAAGSTAPPRRRSRWPVTIAAAGVVAVGIGALAVYGGRHQPAPASNAPAVSEPAATASPTVPISLGTNALCDDAGCANFDPLPLAPGAATFYRSDTAATYGPEAVHLDRFTNLTRCAELTPDGTQCARIEGIAGVGLVDYGASNESVPVEIGTTFTSINPAQYASQWGPTQGGGTTETVVVRGHDGVRYQNELRDAVVWQEASGVLVWVAVDPSLSDQLLGIADSVQPADPAELPPTIPHRVVVAGLGDAWDAQDNDGDGVLVGVHDGTECVGFGYIDHCGTRLEDRVVVRTAGDAIRVSGSTPADVVKVRLITSPEVSAEGETVAFAPYQSRFFSLFVGTGSSLTVEWLNAADQVVDSTVLTDLVNGIDAGVGPVTTATGNTLPALDGVVLAIVDASATPGTADAIAADLAARGYVVASVQTSLHTFTDSMVMPVATPSDDSRELLAVLGVGGFDTWTPTLIDGTLADTVTDVIVVGSNGLPALTPSASTTTFVTVP